MKKNLITVVQGMVMGIVETIPGVSGSTMALIMGIYEDFIDLLHQISDLAKSIFSSVKNRSIKPSKVAFKNINFKFGGLLLVGMITGIIIFSNLITTLLENYTQQTLAFFFGLILFSIPIPFKRIKSKNAKIFILIILTTITFILIFSLPTSSNSNPSLILLFFGGILGVTGFVLPGVSGSFVLLILGLYDYIFPLIKSMTRLQFTHEGLIDITVFGIGLIVGFIVFIRILKLALKSYHDNVMAFLTGLMFASLTILWPFVDPNSSDEIRNMERINIQEFDVSSTITILGIIILTGVLITALQKLAPKKNASQS